MLEQIPSQTQMPAAHSHAFNGNGTASPFGGRTLPEMVREFESSLITAALHVSGGNQRRAAAALGVLPTTLCEKMKRLGLRSSEPAQATS